MSLRREHVVVDVDGESVAQEVYVDTESGWDVDEATGTLRTRDETESLIRDVYRVGRTSLRSELDRYQKWMGAAQREGTRDVLQQARLQHEQQQQQFSSFSEEEGRPMRDLPSSSSSRRNDREHGPRPEGELERWEQEKSRGNDCLMRGEPIKALSVYDNLLARLVSTTASATADSSSAEAQRTRLRLQGTVWLNAAQANLTLHRYPAARDCATRAVSCLEDLLQRMDRERLDVAAAPPADVVAVASLVAKAHFRRIVASIRCGNVREATESLRLNQKRWGDDTFQELTRALEEARAKPDKASLVRRRRLVSPSSTANTTTSLPSSSSSCTLSSYSWQLSQDVEAGETILEFPTVSILPEEVEKWANQTAHETKSNSTVPSRGNNEGRHMMAPSRLEEIDKCLFSKWMSDDDVGRSLLLLYTPAATESNLAKMAALVALSLPPRDGDGSPPAHEGVDDRHPPQVAVVLPPLFLSFLCAVGYLSMEGDEEEVGVSSARQRRSLHTDVLTLPQQSSSSSSIASSAVIALGARWLLRPERSDLAEDDDNDVRGAFNCKLERRSRSSSSHDAKGQKGEADDVSIAVVALTPLSVGDTLRASLGHGRLDTSL